MVQIFIVEDEPDVSDLLAHALDELGYLVVGRATSAESALAQLRHLRPDLVLLDINLEGELDGIETARRLRERHDLAVIFLTGCDDDATIDRAKQVEPYAYLFKPFRLRELMCAIEMGLIRRQREQALRERERTISTILRAIGDGVITVDAAGAITFMNHAAERLTGLHEAAVLGHGLDSVVHFEREDGRQRQGDETLAAVLDAGQTLGPRATTLLAPAGRRAIEDTVAPLVDEQGAVAGAVMVVRDVGPLRQLQQQVAISDRLASLGTLAAGIAHEINTPTQYISDSVRFLKTAFEDLSELVEVYRDAVREVVTNKAACPKLGARIEAAEADADLSFAAEHVPLALRRTFDGIERISGIVRAVSQIGHPGATAMQRADLGALLRDTLVVARSEVGPVADVETEVAELPPVLCHPAELSQVILNLLVNAAHAIADSAGAAAGRRRRGKIRVRLCKEGEEAAIAVSDSGCGIPVPIRARIFDPFFTTKPVGRGTGQGLAIARSIVVDKHRGSITFDSEVGAGSTFVVRIPLSGAGSR